MTPWYGRLADRVEETTGVTTLRESHAEGHIAGYIKRRARELDLSPSALVLRLELERLHSEEWHRLIAVLTNGQTSFFRDREQFDVMARVLRARAEEKRGEPLRIWSCACSTGEEAYSLSILCSLHEIDAEIVGTDINAEFLEAATKGLYDEWSLRNMGHALRRRFFHYADGQARLGQSVRSPVRFVGHNLAHDPPPVSGGDDGLWDLIVCRNVLMYFRREKMAKICSRLAGALAPRGGMILAACESLIGLDVPLEPQSMGGRIVYRRGSPSLPRNLPVPVPPSPEISVIGEESRSPLEERPRAPLVPVEEGDLLAVRKRLETELQVKPTVAGLLDLGHIFLREHRLTEAGEAYDRAERIDSLLAEVHLFRGLVLRKQGRWSEAGQAFRQALFLAPGFWQAAYLLAGVHERLGRHAEAMRERMSTLRLLDEHGDGVALLSNPAFVDWFCPDEGEVRRALRV